MLHLRLFGTHGESLPLPEWTEDRQRFLEWATLPLEEVFPGMDAPKAKPSTAEQWSEYLAACAQAESYALAWATPTPTGYACGWQDNRVFIEPNAKEGPRVQAHIWKENRWRSFEQDHKKFLDQLALAFSGVALDDRNTDMLTAVFQDTHCHGIDPPWRVDNLFKVLEYGYTYKHLEGSPQWILDTLSSTQWSSMERWFTHRFRNMVKSIPDLAKVWRMSRVAVHRPEDAFSHTLDLWHSLRINPNDLSIPFQAFLFSASPGQSPGCNVLAQQMRKAGVDWRTSDFFIFNDRLCRCVPPFRRHLRSQALALPWSAAFRFVKAAAFVLKSTKSIYCPTKYPSPPAVVLELLLTYNQPIPKVEKLVHLMKSPYPLWAWLFLHTSWPKLEHQPAWPNEAAIRTVFESDTAHLFLDQMVALRALHREHPQRLQTVARATVAWLTASRQALLKTRDCEAASGLSSDHQILLQGPHQVIEHLASIDVPEPLFKDLINKRLKWGGVLSLNQKLQEDRLRLTEDFTAPVGEPASTLAPHHPDRPWPSALGNLAINGYDVHPLCRPSHLETMGIFLDNCAQEDNQLESFVDEARAGQSRFFRVTGKGREFLLQISSCVNGTTLSWKVEQFRGRNNHQAPEEAWVVANKVAELYTLLGQAGASFPSSLSASALTQKEGII